MQRSDAKLMAQIAKGQHRSFAKLVKRHHQKCFQIAWRELFSKADAQDVTQIVFMKIWQRPDRYNPDINTTFVTWLYRVTVNACHDLQRKRKNHEPLDEKLEDISLIIPDESAKIEKIKHSLKKLPNTQRQVINLFYFDNLSTKQTAQVLKLSPKAVESHLMRARNNLKPLLQSIVKK